MRRTRKLIFGLLATALVLSACGGDDDDTTDAADSTTTSAASDGATETGVVNIGILTSLSERFGVYGEPFRDGAAYAVEQINEAGGFKVGDTTYTFELHVVDDKSDQAAAVQGATELIKDVGVSALIGPIGPLGPSVTQLTEAAGVLNFSSSSSVSAIAGPPDNPHTFITNGSPTKKIQAAVDSIIEFVPDVESVAILGPDDETSAGVIPVFDELLTDAGLSMESYTYPVDTTDLSTVITRLAADKPDVVILGWGNQDRLTQAPQLKAAGLDPSVPVFLYADALETCRTAFADRPCINHPLAGADLTAENLDAERQEFIDGFLEFTGDSELPTQVAAVIWTYDFPFLIAKAMQKAGTVEDADAIAKALREVSHDGLLGTITFDEGNKALFGFDITLLEPDGTATTQNFG
ncbi:MAG TPA: ABC transporter substrate-binding protein [Acidimicrobiales bacterium]|nr:ABC transporter substrate-binding protein [Acidimicrobiales bacterium]